MSGQAKQQPKTDLQQVAQRAGCPLQKLEAPEEVRGAEKPKEITQNRFTEVISRHPKADLNRLRYA